MYMVETYIATFHLAPGYKTFHAYFTNTNMDAYDADLLNEMDFQSTLVSDDDDKDDCSQG